MRVVHVCRVAPPAVGGMERVVDGLSAHQAASGHAVRIVTTQPGPPHTTAGVPIVRLGRRGPRRWPLAVGLRTALEGAELVHVHGIDGLLDQVIRARPRGAAVGVSTHGGYLHTRRQWWLKQAWLRTGTAWSLARVDAVWFTSAADAEALAPARGRGEVVPNGVDLSRFRAVRQRRAPRRGRWLLPGRVDRHKGHDRALRRLAELDGDQHLDVVGRVEDGLLGPLVAQAQASGVAGRVTWWGEVSDALWDDLMARASGVWAPSRREGFGLTVVEAMAAGIPVIAQPLAPFRAHLDDGRHGALVDFDTPGAVRGVDLERLAAGVPDAAARAETWSWASVMPTWEAAYTRARSGRRP